jgi:hypothetical protein
MNLFGHVDDSGVRLSGDIWSTEEKIKWHRQRQYG